MATYIQGLTDYIPQIQPFQPDLNFYGNVMQAKQTKYDAAKKQFFIDRRNAGVSNFHQGFAAMATAPRFVADAEMDLSLLIDKTSVELFADGGRTVMTALFFPTHPFTNCSLQSKEDISVKTMNLFLFK